MLQRVTGSALILGLLLAGGCVPESGDAKPAAQAPKDNHPEKERKIASKTPDPVMGKPDRGPRQIDYSNPTQDDIRVLVQRAAEHYKHNGDYKAFDDFMDAGSQFISGKTFIFAYDYSGKCLADWSTPNRLGESAQGGDATLQQFYEAIAAKAKSGGGWVTVNAYVPGTTQVRPKECFIVNMNDKFILGSGIYR